MDIDSSKWQEFRFGSLIDSIYKAKAYNKDELIECSIYDKNATRYITRTALNNGCELIVDSLNLGSIEQENAITIGDTTATCYYQDKKFVCGDHIVVIRASWLNKYTGQFIVTLLQREQYRYSYGRAFLMEKIQDTKLILPAADDGNPDWQYMQKYIQRLNHKPITTNNKVIIRLSNVSTWKSFCIKDIFSLSQGKAHSNSLSDGDELPYIGAKRIGNGVMRHCSYDERLVQKGNCIIFICNGEGSVGYANYMNCDFIATTDVVAGYNKNLNQYSGLFIATVLCLERPKYSFGRKWKTHLKETEIKLPSLGEEPDWKYMENYIKSLPYGDRI